MNNRTTSLAMVALLALAALGNGTTAHAAPPKLEADIPFDFAVRGRVLPAGTYSIRLTDRGLLQLRSQDGAQAAAVFTVRTGENTALTEGRLIFAVAGDSRTLIEVWHPGHGNGREILPGFRVRTYAHTDRVAVTLHTAGDNRQG